MSTHDRGLGAVTVLAIVLAITGVWWALALWPVYQLPVWLERTRAVCFGTRANGLPDAAGWTALILQPALMLGAMAVIYGKRLLHGVRTLDASRSGRVALRSASLVALLALAAATWRVGDAMSRAQAPITPSNEPLPSTYPRLDRDAPALGLVDQHADTLELSRFRGQVVLVTFAFAHCETVCPVVVRDVLTARRRLDGRIPASAVIVTLDPWRDVPSRLPSIAGQWQLQTQEHVVSGPVDRVEAVLDAWGIPRSVDRHSGDVTHPALVYVVDASGHIAYALRGGTESIIDLVTRL